MKKFTIISLFFFISFATLFANGDPPAGKKLVKWYTWEEAAALQKKNPKKIMVDVYTHWCGWCKVMDRETFENKEVADYLNEHFYPVKLNAEQKEDINYDGQVFKYVKSGRKGVHTLAYSLLEGRMSYPSIVYLNEQMHRITISPGFKKAKPFKKELTFIVNEEYAE